MASAEARLHQAPAVPALEGSHRPHTALTEFYREDSARPEFLTNLFDESAAHYDWISSVLAFGTDASYRRAALRNAGLKPGMRMLDTATGTGLVARAAQEIGVTSIFGLDPSMGMLLENRRRTGIPLLRGFGEKLPFGDNSFDFISMGYALRHVESLAELFSEFHRVLVPGGRALVLEISRPASAVLRFCLKRYMEVLIPLLVSFRTNKWEVKNLLRYYWATIEHCVSPEKIVAELKDAGFRSVERRRFGPMLNDYFVQK